MTSKLKSYYSFDKLLSYNAVYNFVVGGRGIGKTFGAKKRAITAAIKRGEQFIYLRRYKEELKDARNTFMADIVDEFPDWDFRYNGAQLEVSSGEHRNTPPKERPWFIAGYFIALSTAQNKKSVAYPKVKTIIFDEFIIEKGAIHYLPNEAIAFNNFYLTVDRYKDKTKVYFLANSVTIMNPYFLEYGIEPDEMVKDKFIVKADGFVVAHFPDSAAFKAEVYETRFGRFIKGTEYADYAVGNEFADNHESLIASKNSNSKYLFSLECHTGTFSVWRNRDDEYFVQEKRPKTETLFTLVPEKMTADKILMSFNDRPLANMRGAFRSGRVSFDTAKTRNTFTEVFKR